MSRLRAILAVPAAAAVLALAAAGCGGGDGSAKSSATSTSAGGGTTTVEVGGGGGSASTGGLDAQRIYQREARGVVTVISLFDGGGGLSGILGGGGGDGGGSAGLGSGFVVSDAGEIATNAHVVTNGEGGDLRRAGSVYVQFADLNQVAAKIVGVDPDADVALLKIDPADLDLRVLPFGRLADVDVGEPVAAIGSPYGEPQSLSVGVVSALDRSIESLTGFAISGAIQTDAAINSGNSGGPLLDAQGRVLGINSQIKSSSGSGSGVGFAVSSDTVRHSLDELRRDGRARYAFLGVSTTTVYPQLAEHFHLGVDHGAWVQTVEPGGPAADAGIRGGSGSPERFQVAEYRPGGDVIVAVGRTTVRRDADVGQALLGYEPGQEVEIRVHRGGQDRTVRVKLGERPATSGP